MGNACSKNERSAFKILICRTKRSPGSYRGRWEGNVRIDPKLNVSIRGTELIRLRIVIIGESL